MCGTMGTCSSHIGVREFLMKITTYGESLNDQPIFSVNVPVESSHLYNFLVKYSKLSTWTTQADLLSQLPTQILRWYFVEHASNEE